MRQLSTIILVIFFLFMTNLSAHSAYKGGISYSIPVEYKNLPESELRGKAENFFVLAKGCEGNIPDSNMTNALVLYSVLQNMNPYNIDYSVKLGILYDRINKDRYAKGNFSRAIGVDSSRYEPYYYFGEYYYRRAQYRMALKYYKKALERTNTPNYNLVSRMNDIYAKFGTGERVQLQNETPPKIKEKNKEIKPFVEIDPERDLR